MSHTVLITGASSGLGQATAAQLATTGHYVVLACRDPQRGNATAAAIRAATPTASLQVLQLDLAS